MWKMPAKERIQTRIVATSAVKTVQDFCFALPLTLKMFRQKETPIGYHAAIILITEMWQNVHLWRESQIIKFENAIHICINIGNICERTLSEMSRVTSVRVL